MNREERERMVDRLLNQALAPHDAEPRAGLEERIIHRLQAQPEAHRWWRWLWIPAVAAVLAVAIGLSRRPEPNVPGRESRVASTQPAATSILPSTSPRPGTSDQPSRRSFTARRRTSGSTRETATATASTSAPRLETFPSRSALTVEERMLLGFVKREPREAQTVAQEQSAREEAVRKAMDAVPAGSGSMQ